MRITVLTPTYNRARTLPRLFASLEGQTLRDGFEWLVVDDGSTDDTAAVLDALARDARFPVRRITKANGGKHTAMNAGAAEARGEYTAVIDSDDWYRPEALETLLGHWDALADRDRFVEVQALCAYADGSLIGTPFPADVFDSDAFAIRYQHGVEGDKIGMMRTDLLRSFPFPDAFDGVFVSEALVWHRMARTYRTRFVNAILAEKEYLADGLTGSGRASAVREAAPRRLYFKEIATMPKGMPRKERLRAYANWVRNAQLAGVPFLAELRAASPPGVWLTAVPVGRALAVRDRLRERR